MSANNKRVSQLVELTYSEVQLNDLLLIIDSSAKESKRIQVSDLAVYLNSSGSLEALHAIFADTASYINGADVHGLVDSCSYAFTALNAISASYSSFASNADSSSYALSASYAFNTGSTTPTASFLLYTGTPNGTASFAFSSSHADGADQAKFLVYLGGNNGTASYAIRTGDVDHCVTADTASYFLDPPGTVISASHADRSDLADVALVATTCSFLAGPTGGVSNGTASYALAAGSINGMIAYGMTMAMTQSAQVSQLDNVSVSASFTTDPVNITVEAVGTIIVAFTSSVKLDEELHLKLKSRDNGNEIILDTMPVYVDINATPAEWDTYMSGTIKMPFTMLGQLSASGDQVLFISSSSPNVTFGSRLTRFTIDSIADAITINPDQPLVFYLEPTGSALITFTSTAGGPFTNLLSQFNATSSTDILTINIDSQALTSLKYVWTLSNCLSMSVSNNALLDQIQGVPPSLSYLSCSGCNISLIHDLSNTSMSIFNCNSNVLTSLPGLPSSMSYLNCSNNVIQDLPTTFPAGIQILLCDNNQISQVSTPLPDAIISMSFASNLGLGSIATSLPLALVWCDVSDTQIASLPTLPSNVLYLSAANCILSDSAMESITGDLVTNGLMSGSLDITGNGTPDPTALTNIVTLITSGWTVAYDP
jgi:hypothetical protein